MGAGHEKSWPVSFYGKRQFIGTCPEEINIWLHLEKGLLPKNPRYAESGLGWTDSILWVFGNSEPIFCAWLPQRIATAPWLARTPRAAVVIRCQPIFKCSDLSSRLKYSEDTRVKKSASNLSGVSIDNFIPLVPNIAENVQNTDHIIPEYWIRGGMNSRSVHRNINYLRSCGKQQQ
jgi:hypothetical protein